jgi:hypothetical protein
LNTLLRVASYQKVIHEYEQLWLEECRKEVRG